MRLPLAQIKSQLKELGAKRYKNLGKEASVDLLLQLQDESLLSSRPSD